MTIHRQSLLPILVAVATTLVLAVLLGRVTPAAAAGPALDPADRALVAQIVAPGEIAPHAIRATAQLSTTVEDFFFPGTQPGTLNEPLADPDGCAGCHTDPIYSRWRGSMMGQAGRDPLMWAALEVANLDAAGAGEFCLRCHVSMGWLEGRSDPPDGSGLTAADINGGIACTTCHRMVDPAPPGDLDRNQTTALDAAIRAGLASLPPADHVASAMFIIDPDDNRRGPFDMTGRSVPHTALRSEFLGQSTNYVTESKLCGTCHNIDNPVLSWTDDPPGAAPAQYWPNGADLAAPSFAQGELFPIERTYDEWRRSAYPAGVFAPQFAGDRPDGIVGSCQDCHMPRTTGLAAETIGGGEPVFRDCVTTGCLPAHTLVGGNTWVPDLLLDERWRLAIPAIDQPVLAPILDATKAAARSMLARAATLTVTLESGATPAATVRVTNETGHKLPTGYPEGRRMWLNLRAYDAAGTLLYESGAYDAATGILADDAALKVYEAKQGLTPAWAAELGMEPGATFHFVLNNTYIKDNRIPPRGYTVAGWDEPGLRPVGAVFADGQHWDETTYQLPAETVRVEATLYYQIASKEYIDFLAANGGADAASLQAMWRDSKSPPEVMARAAAPDYRSFLPLTGR